MKTKTANSILAALAVVAISSPAHADDAGHLTGWYGGLNLGQAQARIDDERIANDLAAQGFAQTAIRKDTRDLGFKAFGGYQFNRHFALEGGYFDLGKFGFTAETQPPGTLEGEAKFRGVNLDAVGTLPLTDKFSAFGRAGVHYAETKASFKGSGAVLVADPDRSEKAVNYKVGVGLEYALTQQLGLRGELERYRVKDAVGNKGDVDLASIGLVYRFGTKALAYTPPAAEAAPAAALPPAPTPAPAPRSVILSADSQFDFDRAVVKPEGQRALDQFAVDLKRSRYERITVEGHTDHLGSEAYNADLSSRRAEAVKTYLVESADIPASQIEARGRGESAPLTTPGDCGPQPSGKVSAALIACLQADRRVEVEASVSQ
ncbi:MAG: outer membrane beta-barrel protein [Pseudomonadota bacterium]